MLSESCLQRQPAELPWQQAWKAGTGSESGKAGASGFDWDELDET